MVNNDGLIATLGVPPRHGLAGTVRGLRVTVSAPKALVAAGHEGRVGHHRVDVVRRRRLGRDGDHRRGRAVRGTRCLCVRRVVARGDRRGGHHGRGRLVGIRGRGGWCRGAIDHRQWDGGDTVGYLSSSHADERKTNENRVHGVEASD